MPKNRAKRQAEHGRYRRVSTRMYGDQKFRELSKPHPNGQSLWLYLITGPHTTAVPGLFCIGEAALAEALGWGLKDFRRCWGELAALEMAEADWAARVVWLPRAHSHNPPESPNVVKAWRKALPDIHECALKAKAVGILKAFLEDFGKAFIDAFAYERREAFSDTSPQPSTHPSLNQEQEKDQEIPPKAPPRGHLARGGFGPTRRHPLQEMPDACLDGEHFERAGDFIQNFKRWHLELRNGRFVENRDRDEPEALRLVTAYTDAELEAITRLYLVATGGRYDSEPRSPGRLRDAAGEMEKRLKEAGKWPTAA
jgi:hypothetical protein